jgi:hypothetical protein
MTTTRSRQVTGALVPGADPLFTIGERQDLAGFLCGCSGLTATPTSSTCASRPHGAGRTAAPFRALRD